MRNLYSTFQQATTKWQVLIVATASSGSWLPSYKNQQEKKKVFMIISI
jgi:hypothetical protein